MFLLRMITPISSSCTLKDHLQSIFSLVRPMFVGYLMKMLHVKRIHQKDRTLHLSSVQLHAENMELGLVLTKINISLGWTLSYDLQPGHFYIGGYRALLKVGQNFFQIWSCWFMLIKKDITTWGQKWTGKI